MQAGIAQVAVHNDDAAGHFQRIGKREVRAHEGLSVTIFRTRHNHHLSWIARLIDPDLQIPELFTDERRRIF